MSDSHANHSLPTDQVTIPEGHILRKVPLIGFIVGAVALILSAVATPSGHQFFSSYLVAFMFFLSFGLGGLFFVIIHHASRAGWSVVVRRLAENLSATLPLFAILFLPIAISGIHELFEWSHSEVVEHDEILAGKQPYLNVPFFLGRAALYFAVWCGLSYYYRRNSINQDTTGDQAITRKLQRYSGPAIPLFAITLTFAAFDWLMSLHPHYFSTIFGVYYFAGTVICVMATLSLSGHALQRMNLLKGVVNTEHYHDLGKYLFAFTVFWTYIAFSQFMLIWYANMPEETFFFRMRGIAPFEQNTPSESAWRWVTLFLAIGHFVVPFFFMMSRHIKRRPATLIAGAVLLLIMHWFDLYWLVMPNFTVEGAPMAHEAAAATGPHFSWVDFTCFLGVGGLFLAAYVFQMIRGSALVPLRDPRLRESLAFENF